MKPLLALVLVAVPLFAAEKESGGSSAALPFDRAVINRYSLDHLPRSLSIRQGKDVWFGYDLERAKIYKVWQAHVGKAGLVTAGFVTRSEGTARYEDQSSETWQLRRDGKTVPLSVRYLGCSQREGCFELSWELLHDGAALKLIERVAIAAGSGVERDLRIEGLATGDVLLPPLPTRGAWKVGGRNAAEITGREWHRLTLP